MFEAVLNRQHEHCVAGKQNRQGPSCQQRIKRLVTHDFFKTTSTRSFCVAEAHDTHCGVATQRFGITSGLDFVVFLLANANHGLRGHVVRLSRICFGVAHHPEVVGTIVSQAMPPAFVLIIARQSRLRSEITGMLDPAPLRSAASRQKYTLQLKSMGHDAGKGDPE